MPSAPVQNAFTGTGVSATFAPTIGIRPEALVEVSLWGTGVAVIQLERTFDQGANWEILTAGGTQLYVWSYSGTGFTETASETEGGVLYRLHCTAYTSGTINYRLSQ